MPEPSHEIAFHLETHHQILRMARKLVAGAARLAGADLAISTDIEIAVGEALANAHLHAYHGGVGPIEIEVVIAGPQFTIIVHDHGSPVTAPVFPTERPAFRAWGGRGLYLIAKLMDEATVERLDGAGRGTSIRMVKKLG